MKVLVEQFLRIESHFTELAIDDFYIWPYIRTEVFRLAESYLTNNNFVPVFWRQNVVGSNRRKDEIDSIDFGYVERFLSVLNQKPILIITEKNRFVEIDGKRVCPITSPFEKLFDNQTITVCNQFLTDKRGQIDSFKQFQDLEQLDSYDINYDLIPQKDGIKISADQAEELSIYVKGKIERLLSVELKSDFIKLLTDMINYVCSFTGYTWFYDRIIEQINPKVLIVSSYYCIPHSFFIAEAKKRKIPVFEMQHGTIGNEHVAYNSYLDMHNFFNTPNFLLCYGRQEQKNMRFSIGVDKIIPIGNLFLNEVSRKYNSRYTRTSGSLLFVAFNIENDKLMELALKVKEGNPDRHITYRFHPVEKQDESIISRLTDAGIEISNDFSVSVYDYLAVFDIVIGTKSTVLKEAEVFGNRIYRLSNSSDIELLADDILSETYKYLQSSGEKYYTLNGKKLAKKIIGEYING